MPKRKNSALASRAWRLLRLAVLYARKGSALKRQIRLALDHIKSLFGEDHHPYRLYYGEYELSFESTPTVRSKKYRRPLFPCIDPPLVSFDDDEDGDNDIELESKEECETGSKVCGDRNEVDDEKGIDVKAEEFISRFYEEMKLQRQFSCLRYNEMLCGGMS